MAHTPLRDQYPANNPTPSPAGEPEMPEPCGYLVTGGLTFVDRCFTEAEHAKRSVDSRNDCAVVVPMVRADHAFSYGQAMAEHARRLALEDARELLSAASTYANGYAQDEASDFGPDYTGCSQEQHEDAKRLFSAIRALAGKEGQR